MAIDHVRVDQTPLLTAPDGARSGVHLLWGDRVRTLAQDGAWTQLRARGATGWVPTDALGGPSLLEVYLIDVGQGDGVLVRTPDHRHLLIDGGFRRARQPSGKNAADFVDWKFVRDYGERTVRLDAMICSHNDADHYGGLWDLLSSTPSAAGELDADSVSVEAFHHAGLAWWKQGASRSLGPHETTSVGRVWTRLLEDRASVARALDGGSTPQLAGEWAQFMHAVLAARTASGAPTPIRRISHLDRYLPGFAPADGPATLRVLAPVQFDVAGAPALRRFTGGDSINTNGQSTLLRLDHGRVRILLTGDLNTASQRALLADYAGETQELACDVAKACHHGSDDVSYQFLQAMQPAVTVISSGDAEGHDHPRPAIVAASATTGYLRIEDDRIVSPLVYSTEIARSHQFARAQRLTVAGAGEDSPERVLTGAALRQARASFPKRPRDTTARTRTLDRALFLTDLVYGLVNVRTDGERILCATMNEADRTWEIRTLTSRF